MIKKVLLSMFLLCFCFTGTAFAENTTQGVIGTNDANTQSQTIQDRQKTYEQVKKNFNDSQSCRPNCTSDQNSVIEELGAEVYRTSVSLESEVYSRNKTLLQELEVAKANGNTTELSRLEAEIKENNGELTNIRTERNQSVSQTNEAHKARCAATKSCLDTPDFMFEVGSFAPGGAFGKKGEGTTFVERINWFLGNIIEKLILAIGVVAVFIMTVGGGYMILNSGQDELVNKGKNMFITGVYAVVIALGSYILISLVRFLIYSLG